MTGAQLQITRLASNRADAILVFSLLVLDRLDYVKGNLFGALIDKAAKSSAIATYSSDPRIKSFYLASDEWLRFSGFTRAVFLF